MKNLAYLFSLGALLLAGTAAARPPEGKGPPDGKGRRDGKGPHGRGPDDRAAPGVCREDRQKFCKDAGGRLDTHACLLGHKAELSAPCREKLDKAEGFKTDCKPDSEKYCSEVPPGRGRLVACLTGRKDDLQAACRKHVDDAIAKFKERRDQKAKAKADKPEKP